MGIIDRERNLCMDFACDRLFELDDCSPLACPKINGELSFFMVNQKGEEKFLVKTNYKGEIMKDVATKAVITGPNGFYYREEHEWKNLPPEITSWFNDKQKQILDYITKASSNKEDDGLVAELNMVIDGVSQPVLNVTGISYRELVKFQKFWASLEREILDFGDHNADRRDQDKKRGKWRK